MEKDTIDILNGLIDWDELKRTVEDYKQKGEEKIEMPSIVLEKGEYCIWLISLGGNNEIDVIKKVATVFNSSLVDSYRLVHNNCPGRITADLSYSACLVIKKALDSISCETKILKVNEPLYEGKFKLELLYEGNERIETLKKIKEHFKIDNASALRMLNNLPISLVENASFEQCLEVQKIFDANKCTMQITKIN